MMMKKYLTGEPLYFEHNGKLIQSMVPRTREEAFKQGIAFFYPVGILPSCPEHGGGVSCLYYTVSGLPRCCAIGRAWSAQREAADYKLPTSGAEALREGLTWYYSGKPGRLCGHNGKVTLKGACWHCLQASLNSPRQVARKKGLVWFQPLVGSECKRCGSLARRRVSNSSCEECERIAAEAAARRPDGRRAELDPARLDLQPGCSELVIDREAARAAGFSVYRTGAACRRGHMGWRYVSTGNCLPCLAGVGAAGAAGG